MPPTGFSQISQKIRETRSLTSSDTENCLMTSYLRHIDGVSKILNALGRFVPDYHCAKFGGNWTTCKGSVLQPMLYQNSLG